MLAPYFIFPSIHTTLYLLLAFIGGILTAHLKFPVSCLILLSGLIAIGILILKEMRPTLPFLIMFLPLAPAAGAGLYTYQYNKLVAFQAYTDNKLFDAQGHITSIDTNNHSHFKYRIKVEGNRLKIAPHLHWQPYTYTIVVYTHSRPSADVGDLIEITQLKGKWLDNATYNLFLAKERINASFFVEKLTATIIDHPTYSITRLVHTIKAYLLQVAQTAMNKETYALFSSIFLGNKTESKDVMEEKKELFKVWGTSHYLARSGLHLILFTLIWHFLLSLLPIYFLYKQFILLFLIAVYALFSWTSISFERALLIFLIFKITLIAKVPSHYVHMVGLVTFILLFFNPLQLFFIDFQLSFGLTFALAWFNSIQDYRKRIS